MAMPRPRVVFLPGIMGSVLVQTSPPPRIPAPRVIWGTARATVFWRLRPKEWQGRLLQGNGLNRHGKIATDVPPRETTDGLLEMRGLSVPYTDFIARLRREALADVLVFPYDWRLSNDVSALELESAIRRRWFAAPALEIAPHERVTIIAHSMGGLVARNFIEGRNGHTFVQRLITAGTPHQGAPTAYTHFLGKTQSLPSVVMPLGLQLGVLKFCASALQLLPNYDFVVLRGGAVQPRAATYAAMPAHPTGTSVADVIRLMRDGFQPRAPWASLNAFLNAAGVTYHCLGSTGLKTVSAYDAYTGFVFTNLQGDSTVPLMSALCPEGPVTLTGGVCAGTSNVRQQIFRKVLHQDLFLDRGVQDACLRLLGVTPAAREMEFELEAQAAVAEIEAELTVPTY
jgi:hypothetical protein